MNFIRRFRVSSLFLFVLLLLTACPSNEPLDTRRLNVPKWGMVIEAYYDPKLNGILPSYKIVTVTVTNRSFELIHFDPTKDRWYVEDSFGKKHEAVIFLAQKEPEIWAQLPNAVRSVWDYPAGVPVGRTQLLYLFVSSNLDLDRFRSVSFYSAHLRKYFDALSNYSIEKSVPVGQADSPQVIEKYGPPKTRQRE